MCVYLTPDVSFSNILLARSWLSPLGCHTETLPSSRSKGLSNGGVEQDGGTTGGVGGDEEDGIVGDNGSRRGGGQGIGSEGWGERMGGGDAGVGERGGGRDGGGGLEDRVGGDLEIG